MAKIVVLDDDPSIHELVSVFFGSSGHEVTNAETHAQLESALETGEMDLVLLDVNMPGLDGAQVARDVKARGMPVKVMLYSGSDEAQLRQMARSANADGYVQKGVDPPTLLLRVNRCLRKT